MCIIYFLFLVFKNKHMTYTDEPDKKDSKMNHYLLYIAKY
jgi:hypothetical protein